jgi:hypothetical protein
MPNLLFLIIDHRSLPGFTFVPKSRLAPMRVCRSKSLMTSKAEIGWAAAHTQFPQPHAAGPRADPGPFGFRRSVGICGVGAPRRCTPTSPASRRLASGSSTMYSNIACVAPPCICPRGARNAMPPNSRTGSQVMLMPLSAQESLIGIPQR